MAKHTPGPWIAAPYSSVVGAPIVAAGTGRIVGHTFYPHSKALPAAYVAECDANRALLGAAPDLLAALKAASEVLVQDDCPMIYAQVQAALAKAEGRT